MSILIATISSENNFEITKILKIIKSLKWEKVFLICDEYYYQKLNFKTDNIFKILFCKNKSSQDLIDELSNNFKKSINDFEIFLNIESSSGLENMILISAILKAGLSIKMIHIENNKLKEMKILDIKKDNSYNDDFF